MTNAATLGHNNPPSPLDDAIGIDPDALELAESILTGEAVTNDAQMRACDDLLKRIKAIAKAVDEAKTSESKPLHDAWKTCLAGYKPTETDLERIRKGLIGMVDGYKRKKREAEEEAQRQANIAAAAARREAEEAARAADVSDLDAQRDAEAKRIEAEEANRVARELKQDQTKGLRKVQRHEITNLRDALNDIVTNDREAMTAFIEDYVKKNFKRRAINGVRVWEEREAF